MNQGYQGPSIQQKIIENIVQMLDINTDVQKYSLRDYQTIQLRVYKQYRTVIYPKLRQLIEAKRSQMSPVIYYPQYLRNDQKVLIYESVFAQFDPQRSNEYKERSLKIYKQNQHLLDKQIRLSIQGCFQVQKYIYQYSTISQKIMNLHLVCKKYSKQSHRSLSLSETIDSLHQFINKTTLINENQQQSLTQIDSVSILLEQLLDKMKDRKKQSNLSHFLQNIKSESIKKPMRELIHSIYINQYQDKYNRLMISLESLASKYRISCISKEPFYIIDQIDRYISRQFPKNSGNFQIQQLESTFKKIIEPVYKYVFDKDCLDFKREIIYNSKEFIDKINDKNYKSLKINEQYMNLHVVINQFLFFIDGTTNAHLTGNKYISRKLDQVKNNFSIIKRQRNQFQSERNYLRQEFSKLRKDKNILQDNNNYYSRKIHQLQSRCDKLIKEKQNLQKQAAILQDKVKQNVNQLNKAQTQKYARKNDEIQQLMNNHLRQMTILDEKYKNQQQTIINLQSTIRILNETISQKQQLIKSWMRKYESLDQEKILLRQKRDELFQMLGEQKIIIDRYEDEKIVFQKKSEDKYIQEKERMKKQWIIERNKEIEKIKAEKSKLAQQCSQLFTQLQQLKEKYYNQIGKRLYMSCDLSNSRLSDKAVGQSFFVEQGQPSIQNLQQSVEQNTQQILSEQNIEELKNEYKKQFEDDINKLKKENNLLKQVIQLRETELKAFKVQEQYLKDILDKNQSTIKQMEQKLGLLEKQSNKLRQDIQILSIANKKYEQSQNSFKKMKNQKSSFSDILHPHVVPFSYILFNRKVFDNRQEQKQVLIKHVESYTKAGIIKTELLFEYNEKNKVNFHPYIDNKKYFICVVRTSKVIVAGFYPGQICEKKIMNEGGLLISITKDKSFKLQYKKQEGKIINYRAMTYDPYYIVFGNAELRIKTGEKMLFSNYGMTTGYFDYSQVSKKAEYFLQEGDEREVQILEYQCYQLFFDRNLSFNQDKVQQENIFRTA